MAYVTGFEHDIFISYASVNNPEPENDKPGWVTNFRVKLENELVSRIGRDLKIWMDEKDIAVGDKFRDKILGGVETSAILLIILSETYLDSDWCTTERKAFLEQVSRLKESDIGGLSGLNRIFVVRFEDVNRDGDNFPSELKGLQEIDFFRVDENKKVYTLGWPQLLTTDIHYHKFIYKLMDLSTELVNQLKKLKILKDKDTASKTKATGVTTAENRYFYEKMMKDCHGLIVIYGESDESWVNLVLEKSVTIARDKPLETGAIIQGPPPLNDEEEKWIPFKPRFMRKIDCISRFNEEELRKFLFDVKESFKKYNLTKNSGDTSPDFGAIVFVNAIGKDKDLAKKICKMADEDYGMTYYCSPQSC